MKLIIELTENQCSLQVEGDPTLQATLKAVAAVALHGLKYAVSTVPEEEKQAATEALYDQANAIFSSVLEDFAPDHTLRPDLTATILMEKENELISKLADAATATTSTADN